MHIPVTVLSTCAFMKTVLIPFCKSNPKLGKLLFSSTGHENGQPLKITYEIPNKLPLYGSPPPEVQGKKNKMPNALLAEDDKGGQPPTPNPNVATKGS